MKKLLFIFLLSLLSSCTLGISNTSTETSTNSDSIISDTSKSDTVLDDYYLNEAIKQNDSSKCDNILDTNKKKECTDVLSSLAVMKEATEKLTNSKCDEIPIERYRNSCKIDVEAAKKINEEEKLEESKRLMEAEEISKILEEANQKQDLSLCDNLSDVNQKDACYYNVIVSKSIQAKDFELCEQIPNETYKEACRDSNSLITP